MEGFDPEGLTETFDLRTFQISKTNARVDDRVGKWLVDYEGSLYWTELDTLRTTELVDRLDEHNQQ